MYLLSYDARSLTLLIASRFVMGFGAAQPYLLATIMLASPPTDINQL